MNDQKILALMAAKPDIRAVQIADTFDVSLKDASEAMRSLVEVGDVVQSKGVAPNQQPCMVYNLSDAFRRSKEGRAILGAQPEPAQVIVVAPIDLPAFLPPNPVATPPARQQPAATPPAVKVAGMGSVAVGIIIEQGAVSNAALKVAMGLAKGQYPSAFLGAAIKAGKVHNDKGTWRPGRVQPVTAVAATPADRRTADVGIQGRALDETLPGPSGLPAAAKLGDIMADGAAEPVFRCGLWSDGVIELQRDGVMVAQLVQREGEHLAGFINRMLVGATAAKV